MARRRRELTRFPVARFRYTKSTGLWAIYWRDRHLKFHEYKRKRPSKKFAAPSAFLDNVGNGAAVAVIGELSWR